MRRSQVISTQSRKKCALPVLATPAGHALPVSATALGHALPVSPTPAGHTFR